MFIVFAESVVQALHKNGESRAYALVILKVVDRVWHAGPLASKVFLVLMIVSLT